MSKTLRQILLLMFNACTTSIKFGQSKKINPDLISKLKIDPIDLVRKKEKIWIEEFKNKVLSPKENELLKMLAEYKNDLLTREKALKKIWGSDTYFNGRSMDVYIAKLRKYLKEDSTIEIVNIHGNGFRLVVQ